MGQFEEILCKKKSKKGLFHGNMRYTSSLFNTLHFYFILFLFFAAFHSNSFMEVFKAAYKKGSMARDSVAIRADQKSYSYDQLASSALRISSLLCSNDLKTVSSNHLF